MEQEKPAKKPGAKLAIILLCCLLTASVAGNLLLAFFWQEARGEAEQAVLQRAEDWETLEAFWEDLQEDNAENDAFWMEIYEEYAFYFGADGMSEEEGAGDEGYMILSAIFAYQTEQVTKDCTTDAQRALTCAIWVASNISNRDIVGWDDFSWYASRTGTCAEKSYILRRMMDFLSIDARIMDHIDFDGPGNGHTCIEVFYEDAWHYFDLQYGGYFERDGNILSLGDILDDPASALENTVIFPYTLDRWGSFDMPLSERARVSNEIRFATAYDMQQLEGYGTSWYTLVNGEEYTGRYPLFEEEMAEDSELVAVSDISP